MKTETSETEYQGEATYSPEDNKLRLYIGRVPREEYLKLRAEGWVTLHKQREAGGGDFAAVWTPQRRDTALAYAGVILDEDMGPAERAADRAERFSGYRDRRTDDATGHADRYDAGPTVHGYQNQAKAERSAARHDRIADRSLDAWSKAEYWQRRTAGVINHALHKSSPGVRMGRIKTLEAELRKMQSGLEEYAAKYSDFQKLAAIADPEKQTAAVWHYVNTRNLWSDYMHPRPETVTNAHIKTNPTSLYTLMSMKAREYGTDDITGAEACALFFSDHSEPATETDWTEHLKLRLAYENQMLEAQGGRAAMVEMVAGGWIGSKQIQKVNKSTVTGRVVSVALRYKTNGLNRWGNPDPNAPEYRNEVVNIERASADVYRPPTEAELAAFLDAQKAQRKAAKAERAKTAIPLINPTDADAERLQALWNERARVRHEKKNTYTSAEARKMHSDQFQAQKVCRITQATYSANSGGAHSKAETSQIEAGGKQVSGYYRREKIGNPVCQVRTTSAEGSTWYMADRVIVLTDKPQKPLPAAVWEVLAPEPEAVNA